MTKHNNLCISFVKTDCYECTILSEAIEDLQQRTKQCHSRLNEIISDDPSVVRDAIDNARNTEQRSCKHCFNKMKRFDRIQGQLHFPLHTCPYCKHEKDRGIFWHTTITNPSYPQQAKHQAIEIIDEMLNTQNNIINQIEQNSFSSTVNLTKFMCWNTSRKLSIVGAWMRFQTVHRFRGDGDEYLCANFCSFA